MRERPILMSGPMVRACLREIDPKTGTRRAVKPQPDWLPEVGSTRRTNGLFWPIGSLGQQCGSPLTKCPYGAPGDLLWVREAAWYDRHEIAGLGMRCFFEGGHVRFANGSTGHGPGHADTYTAEMFALNSSLKKRPGILMPRWASRITLRITDVRVERLQEISEADARAEGIVWQNVIVDAHCAGGVHREVTEDRYWPSADSPEDHEGHRYAEDAYAELWDSINGPGSWAANPWVWVVAFERVERGSQPAEGTAGEAMGHNPAVGAA